MEHPEYGTCSPYSNGWCEAWNDASDDPAKRREMREDARRYRASDPREMQCIRLTVIEGATRGETHDRIQTFRCVGWRGALAILRVYAPRGASHLRHYVEDDRIATTLEMWEGEGVEGVRYAKAWTVADAGVW